MGISNNANIRQLVRVAVFFSLILLVSNASFAAGVGGSGSPWETAAEKLMTAFTGPISKALSLVAIVIGGLTFAFGEGGAKKTLAGIIFGIGMAVGAVNFMNWLFPSA
jgi:type IV secretory pathway VirB2 component (pilin)